MKKFREYLQEQMLFEAPMGGPPPSPGGLAGPASLPPGGPGPGMGGGLGVPPPMMGGMAPPTMGGPPMGGGPMGGPGMPQNAPVMKLKSPDVWEVLEKVLGLEK